MIKKLPSQKRIRELFNYDPETGKFLRRMDRGGGYRIGTEAGSLNTDGYVVICIDGVNYRGHRIAFVYMTGKCPPEVDHVNLVRSDNRFENLRSATRAQNRMNIPVHKNSMVGLKGVSFRKKNGYRRPYDARIRVNGKLKHIGRFVTAEEAHAAYAVASKKFFGEFARA